MMCIYFFPFGYKKIHECSCDICGKNFATLGELKKHIKKHTQKDKEYLLLDGFGIARCNKCFISFVSVEALEEHGCC